MSIVRIERLVVAAALALVGCGAAAEPRAPKRAVVGRSSAPLARTLEAPLVVGPRTEGEVEQTIRANMGPLRGCFEQGLLRDPQLHGQILTNIVIERDGRVSSVSDACDTVPTSAQNSAGRGAMGRPFPDQEVVTCVHQCLRSISFPAHAEGAAITVLHPITFGSGG